MLVYTVPAVSYLANLSFLSFFLLHTSFAFLSQAISWAISSGSACEHPVRMWDVNQVGEWLDASGLGHYRSAIGQASVDGIMLLHIEAPQIDAIVGHHDDDLIRAIQRLQQVCACVCVSE